MRGALEPHQANFPSDRSSWDFKLTSRRQKKGQSGAQRILRAVMFCKLRWHHPREKLHAILEMIRATPWTPRFVRHLQTRPPERNLEPLVRHPQVTSRLLMADIMSGPNTPIAKGFLMAQWRTIPVDRLFGPHHIFSLSQHL